MTQESRPTAYSFFQTVEQLHEEIPLLHLRTDWRQLVRDKQQEAYQAGAIRWVNAAGDTTRLDLRLRARGNMRKTVCNYPPVQVRFDREQLHAAGLDSSFNDVKADLSRSLPL